MRHASNGGWDYGDILRKNKPDIGFNNRRRGTCQFRMPDGTPCGEPFTGPPNRKYCSEHSKDIQFRGTSTVQRCTKENY